MEKVRAVIEEASLHKIYDLFSSKTINRDGSRARRQRLASFLRYYRLAENVRGYNIKERIGEWKGKTMEVLPSEKDGSIYIP